MLGTKPRHSFWGVSIFTRAQCQLLMEESLLKDLSVYLGKPTTLKQLFLFSFCASKDILKLFLKDNLTSKSKFST